MSRIASRKDSLKRPSLFLVAVLLGAGVGMILPASLVSRAHADLVDTDIQFPDPGTSLASAKAASPFTILAPTALPADAKMVLVDWIPPEQNDGVMNVDLWWTSGAGLIHVWETDNPSIPADKDPASPQTGSIQSINGGTWILAKTEFDNRIALSSHLPGGVTVSIDATMSVDDLEALAASLKPAS